MIFLKIQTKKFFQKEVSFRGTSFFYLIINQHKF